MPTDGKPRRLDSNPEVAHLVLVDDKLSFKHDQPASNFH